MFNTLFIFSILFSTLSAAFIWISLKPGKNSGKTLFTVVLTAGIAVIIGWPNYSIASYKAECGNAIIDEGEACDDGNVNDEDGCSSLCQDETGWLCTDEPSACHQFVDLTDRIEAVTSATAFSNYDWGGYIGWHKAANAFDDGEPNVSPSCGIYCTYGYWSPEDYLQYDFGAPEEIYGYNFIPQNITYHTPMVWYVAGSNDGSAWTTIETGSHSGVWTEGEQYESLFARPQTYRYFKFVVTENLTGYAWCITEMEILGLPSPVCGNNIIESGEQCDDGNTQDGDNCSSACQIEAGCGNGILEEQEQCDDGQNDNGDGCNENCQVETGWLCTDEPSVCQQFVDLTDRIEAVTSATAFSNYDWGGYIGWHEAANAFDDGEPNVSPSCGIYCTYGYWSPEDYLQYDFGAPEEIYGYNFIPQNITYHTPMVWYVAGSNDGSAWTTIETGAHSGVWTEGEQYESLFASPQTYRYFRFIVTENLTNYAWCITEMEILGLPSVFGN